MNETEELFTEAPVKFERMIQSARPRGARAQTRLGRIRMKLSACRRRCPSR